MFQFFLEQVDRLDGLWFESMHDVYDQDGDITEGRAARTQIAERLVARSVYDEQPRNLQLLLLELRGKET